MPDRSTPELGADPHQHRRHWARMISRVTLTTAVIVTTLMLAWSVAPDLFTSFDPINGVVKDKFLPPGADHWFGTDYLGRDVYSRVVHGAGQSVSGGLVAVLIGLIGGASIGLFAGLLGGAIDSLLMRAVDVILAIPSLLMAVIIVVSLGFATVNAAIAIGISSVAVFARLMRSEVLKIRHLPFVEASLLAGASRVSVLVRHIVPNTFASMVALAVLQFGAAILAISGLAFLGYGNPPPAPEWGLLIAEGHQYLASYPWMVLCPGAVLVVVVIALNRLSMTLRTL